MVRLSKIKTALLEAVFPSDLYCIRCGRIIDKSRYYGLCDKCSEGFNWVGADVCEKCGRLLGPGRRSVGQGGAAGDDATRGVRGAGRLCGDCQRNERHFDKGYTCVFYGVYAREVVAAMKMKNRPWIGRKLGEAMADRMACESEPIDLVIPVPVHPDREIKRGYNQAAVIARQFVETRNEKCGGPDEDSGAPVRGGRPGDPAQRAIFLDALKRLRRTEPMKGLDVWQRKANVEGAFELKPGMAALIRNKNVAIVDDLMTTGSTLSECARILKEAGAARVITVTFASGGDMDPASEEVTGGDMDPASEEVTGGDMHPAPEDM